MPTKSTLASRVPPNKQFPWFAPHGHFNPLLGPGSSSLSSSSQLADDFQEESEAYETYDTPAYLQKIVDDIRNLEIVYFTGRDSESIPFSGWYE